MPRSQDQDVQSVIENFRNLDALTAKFSAMQGLRRRDGRDHFSLSNAREIFQKPVMANGVFIGYGDEGKLSDRHVLAVVISPRSEVFDRLLTHSME